MNAAFATAAVLSAILTLLHLFRGGRTIAEPLLESDGLARMPKVLMYFCWHITSISIAFMAAAYGYAALIPGNSALAIAATLLSAAIAILGVSMAPVMGLRYGVMPQGWLFLVIALVGGLGLR